MDKMTRCVRCEKYFKKTLPILGRQYCPKCFSNEKAIHNAVKGK